MCQDHHNNKNSQESQRGTSLKDAQKHEEDHHNWSRRGFLRALGLATGGGVAMGGFSLSAMASSALSPLLAAAEGDDRILVLIRLNGGNDGLNTIIPVFDYGKYQQERPSIAIPQNQIIGLTDKFGMPNSMQNLLPMWQDGQMKVINTVGYDNHNLSHFNSTDIFATANQNIQNDADKSGWLGRYILNQDPDYLEDLPSTPAAIKISSGGSLAYQNSDQIDLAVNFNTPDRLIEVAETGFVYDTVDLPDDCYYGEQVGFLRSILNVTYNYAPQISEAYTSVENSVEYSNNELSRQLAIVARLIKGGLGTRLYMVTLSGFDTHENQTNNHASLMNALSSGVSEFYTDLAASQQDQRVLSMTLSEFGRRINENDGGTDHGTAAPVMMFGPALEGNGILGDDPDMNDVDANGNLKHSVDFRSIYASILESWLCLDAAGVDEILGDTYDRMEDLGFDCTGVSSGLSHLPMKQAVQHGVRQDGQGGIVIDYELDRPGTVNLTIFTLMGQKLATLENGYKMNGKHQAYFSNRYQTLSKMPLVYRLVVNDKKYSGKFILGL